MLRSASFLVQRFVLGRDTLLARIPQFDLELRVAAREAVGRHLFRDGVHAPEVADYIATTLELAPGELIFDLGAGVGWHALLLSRILPRGAEVHAFEPDPWARGLLQENASRNRAEGLVVVPAAIGEQPGHALLHRYGARRRRRAAALGSDSIGVEMVALDDYCRRRGLAERPVGFIKLGIQGWELAAARGARDTLSRCRTVLLEFAPALIEQTGPHPAELLDLLVDQGLIPAVFEAQGLRSVTRAELLADGAARNVLWRRPDAALAERQEPDPI